ncbi:MAG: hypothetical protein AMK70_11775 [Nitrospira bacterium SG8_35_1]|nr:MAG: hypothetical protein AMK70_11775 [Nitrospira bacterium SG8_35_1]
MNIKPLYKSEREILVGLNDDFRELCVLDGLVMIVDLLERKIVHPPWSGQKILMKGDYTPIMIHQKNEFRQKIKKSLKRKMINDIENQLKHPPEEAVNSLIWKPERFI